MLLFILSVSSTFADNIDSQVFEQDSLALVAIYNATNGPDWTNNSGWLNGPVTDWYGVDLEDNKVSRLLLESNNLVGTIPEEIGNLTNIELLKIGINKISGQIPSSIGNCTKLSYLDVRGNELTGNIPIELSNCTELKTIWAINNQFSGSFPEALLLIPGIEVIRLGGNDFDGQIPASINNLVHLEVLELGANGFSGTMPSLNQLIDLVVLYIWGNELEGDMSEILGYHPYLCCLRCFDNKFSGCLSEVHFNPENLDRLEIYDNEFDCVGDFSSFVDTGVISRFLCRNNKIPFEFLEKNVGVETFTYDKQDSLLSPEIHLLAKGGNLQIDSGTRGHSTSYTWYKDNQVIPNKTDSTLVIQGFSEADEGTYYMKATNSILPDLTLYRHKVHVQADEISGTRYIAITDLRVYPNPASGQIFFDDLHGEGLVMIFDINGKVVFDEWKSFNAPIPVDGLPTGLFVLNIQLDGKIYKSKFVKL